MAQFPPDINVTKDSEFEEFAASFRSGSADASNMLLTTAGFIHPLMVGTMQKYGLDHPGRFGIGSSAHKVAGSVVNKMKRAADCYVDGGMLVTAAYVEFVNGFWIPYQLAKKAATTGGGRTFDDV